MKKLTLLRKIQRSELSIFQKYLHFVYEKTDNGLPFFEYLKKSYPDFDIPEDPDEIHDIVFGGKESYKKKISNLFSDINLKLKDFFLYLEIKSDSFDIKHLWVRVLQKQGLKQEFAKASKQLFADAQSIKKKSTVNYLQTLLANHIYYNESDPAGTALDATDVQAYTDNLDISYALLRLKTACEMISLNRIKVGQYDLHKIGHVEALIPQDHLAAHPLLQLYLSLYQLVKSPSDDVYEASEALYRKNASFISPEEMNKALSYLLNYGAVRVRDKAHHFWQKSYLLIKFTFEEGIFSRTGAVSSTLFNNLVHIACKAKEFKWANEFIEKQIRYINPELQSDTRLIAEATSLFEQKKYAETLTHLSESKFPEVVQFMRANTMILISSYEMQVKETDLTQLCKNFETYLYRHQKKTTTSAHSFLNFSKILRLLLRSTDSREVIEQEIENAGPTTQSEWLIEKIATYEPQYAAHKRKK